MLLKRDSVVISLTIMFENNQQLIFVVTNPDFYVCCLGVYLCSELIFNPILSISYISDIVIEYTKHFLWGMH